MSSYDQWLTTDTMSEAQSAAADAEADAWTGAVDYFNLPVDADEEEHPYHAIYVKWEAFYEAAMDYHREQEMRAEMEIIRWFVAWYEKIDEEVNGHVSR